MDQQGGLIRATTLAGYENHVRQLGHDPYALLEMAGLSRVYLREPQLYLPFSTYLLLMELSARETGNLLFGAELGLQQGLRVLGSEAYGVSSGFTLREALAFLFRNLTQQTTAQKLRLETYDELVLLSSEITIVTPYGASQTHDQVVGNGIRMMKSFYGESWLPREVFLQHSLPPEHKRSYRRLFGERICFDAEVTGFTFALGLLDTTLPEADPMAHKMFTHQQQESALQARGSFTQHVENIIRVNLASGEMSLESTARLLATSPRSLQRRLMDEGTSFIELVDATRCQVAEQYLLNCDLQMSQVSELLGFSQLSNLSHAFKRWHGMSPSAWKKLRHQTAL